MGEPATTVAGLPSERERRRLYIFSSRANHRGRQKQGNGVEPRREEESKSRPQKGEGVNVSPFSFRFVSFRRGRQAGRLVEALEGPAFEGLHYRRLKKRNRKTLREKEEEGRRPGGVG